MAAGAVEELDNYLIGYHGAKTVDGILAAAADLDDQALVAHRPERLAHVPQDRDGVFP
jgi:hypothetical protein